VFIETYPSDGGCDEGPGYWGRAGASLFDCLELLSISTNNKLSVYDEPLVQKMASFIYRTHIDGQWYVNFADASARVKPSPYLVYKFGQRVGDPKMEAFGASLRAESDRGRAETLQRYLPQLFSDDSGEHAGKAIPYESQVWLDQIEVMCAREASGTPEGLFLGAKGGHNAESHNHNDIGNFIVYTDGQPLLVDAGVGTYTGQTFGDTRYELFTMRSGYHNVPIVNGHEQKEGEQYRSSRAMCAHSDRVSSLTLDIAKAYPEEARIVSWNRTIRLERPDIIFINDVFEVEEVFDHFFLNLITPSHVSDDEAGTLTLTARELPDDLSSGSGRVLYPSERFRVRIEEIEIEDARLAGVWGHALYRISLRATDPKRKDSLHLRITQ